MMAFRIHTYVGVMCVCVCVCGGGGVGVGVGAGYRFCLRGKNMYKRNISTNKLTDSSSSLMLLLLVFFPSLILHSTAREAKDVQMGRKGIRTMANQSIIPSELQTG